MSDKNDNKKGKNKSLKSQILKFAVVGGVSCVIDFAIYSALYYLFLVNIMSEINAAGVASVFGFLISLIFNYIASMAFVFERREDVNRATEFIVFTVLSIIGLILNTVIIMGVMWMNEAWVVNQTNILATIVNWINGIVDAVVGWLFGIFGKVYEPIDWIPIEAKVLATGIVMVYNFVTRKKFIEKQD